MTGKWRWIRTTTPETAKDLVKKTQRVGSYRKRIGLKGQGIKWITTIEEKIKFIKKNNSYNSKEKHLTDVEKAFKASAFSNKVISSMLIFKKQLTKKTSTGELEIEDIQVCRATE